MNIIDKIFKEGVFVIHALKGYEYHEERINKLFGENNISFEFVTDGDPKFIDKNVLNKYFRNDIERLPIGIISCTLNHIHAYERMVEKNIPYALVFENDPFFLGDIKKQLSSYSDEIENIEKGFIISLENSTLRFPSYWQTKKGKNIYKANAGRMAGAYLIDLQGAKNILNNLADVKCHTVIDWWHNSLIENNVVDMHWVHPPITEQGSHNGQMSSTISSKPDNLLRKIKWKLNRFAKYYLFRLLNQKHIIEE